MVKINIFVISLLVCSTMAMTEECKQGLSDIYDMFNGGLDLGDFTNCFQSNPSSLASVLKSPKCKDFVNWVHNEDLSVCVFHATVRIQTLTSVF